VSELRGAGRFLMRMPVAGKLTAILAGSLAFLASCTNAPASGSSASGRDGSQDALSGARLFRGSCAACHGEKADGNGPVAPLLNVPVPDLTRIATRRHGEFPELEVFRIIDGQSELTAHGSRHMPVWGYEFYGDDADDEVAHRRATERVDRLVAYLRSIQRN
jgi:mono/diheme cytochrome c family protein